MPPLPEGEAGDAVRAGVLRGMYRFAGPLEVAGRQRLRPQSHDPVLGPDVAGRHGGRAILAEDWGVSRRRLVGDVVHRAASTTPCRSSAPTACTRRRRAGSPTSPTLLGSDARRARGGRDATTCGPCPTRWPAGSPRPFVSLGTDGFGRSDTRAALRRFFEVDAAHIVVAVLSALAGDG